MSTTIPVTVTCSLSDAFKEFVTVALRVYVKSTNEPFAVGQRNV